GRARHAPRAAGRTLLRTRPAAGWRSALRWSNPVPSHQEPGVEVVLGRARLVLALVGPTGQRRHRHQDRLGTSARLQAEVRAAVPHQVEFDVAAAPVQLEIALTVTVRQVLAALQDRHVGIQETIGDRSHHREAVHEAAFGEVVEEDATDAALLAAVLQAEILVAPGLEARVLVAAEWVERGLADAMEMNRVLLEAVIGRQVHAAAEPDHGIALLRRGGQHANVHVHRGRVRIARMEHQRHAQRLETAAGALEHLAVLQDHGDAVALQGFALALLPLVLDELAAVHIRASSDDAILQLHQVVAYGFDVGHGFTARWPMSRRYCAPSKRMPWVIS